MKPLFFPLLLLLLFTGIHYLAYRRILLRIHLREGWRRMLTLLLLLNGMGVLTYLGGRYLFDLPAPLYFFASLSIGVGFLLLLGIAAYELLHLLQRVIPLDRERRAFFKRASDAGFVGLGAAYLGTGLFNGETHPRIFRVKVDQGHFSTPLRIAQISDLHIGGLIDRDFVRGIVEKINREAVDLVAITGDLLDTSLEKNRPAVDELLKLRSRLGTFYVVGNHEYFHGIETILAYLRGTPISVLENDSRELEDFHIVGLYDLFGHRFGSYRPDPRRAFAGIPPDRPTLLLMHQPRGIAELEGVAAPSLILSGHTHGGQIAPFGSLVKLVQPYLRGLHRLGEGRAIYVNRGVGFWGPPMRIGAQAEITILEWS
jgi:predicted MPP superfamily phosphohydrolase